MTEKRVFQISTAAALLALVLTVWLSRGGFVKVQAAPAIQGFPTFPNTFYGTVIQGASPAAPGTAVYVGINRQSLGSVQVQSGTPAFYSAQVNGAEGDQVTFRSDDYEFAQVGIMASGSALQPVNLTSTAFADSQTALVDQAVTFNGHGGAPSLIIDPGGQNMGNTTVQVKANQPCATSADTVQRCFQISPTTPPTGSGATLTFYFYPSQLNGMVCDVLNAYHWNGSGWDTLTLDTSYDTDGRECTNKPHSVRVTGVTDFSAFALKAGAGPTRVGLTRLVAASEAQGAPPWGFGLVILSAILVAARRRRDLSNRRGGF